MVGCLVDLDPCCLLTERLVFKAGVLVLLDHHLSWDSFFLVWGDANGKFTYIPKYKPEISKLDYTNSSLRQTPSRSRYFSPVQVDGIDRPFGRTFAQR